MEVIWGYAFEVTFWCKTNLKFLWSGILLQRHGDFDFLLMFYDLNDILRLTFTCNTNITFSFKAWPDSEWLAQRRCQLWRLWSHSHSIEASFDLWAQTCQHFLGQTQYCLGQILRCNGKIQFISQFNLNIEALICHYLPQESCWFDCAWL